MITRTTETAFRILIVLASLPAQRVVPLGVLHASLGGSQTYLAKVTAALTRAQIVRSSRGSLGGLVLARQPQEISLLDVLTAIQGMPSPACCATVSEGTVDICGYHQVMGEVHQSILDTFRSRSVADLLNKPCGISPDGSEHLDCRMHLQKK